MENTSQKQIDELLGYGQKMRVFVGTKEDGSEIIEEYHFTPVPMRDVPLLGKLLDEFMQAGKKGAWNEEAMATSAKIIQMSIKRVHPDVSLEKIQEVFTLGMLAKAVKVIMDLNDFLSEMQAIAELAKMSTTNQS